MKFGENESASLMARQSHQSAKIFLERAARGLFAAILFLSVFLTTNHAEAARPGSQKPHATVVVINDYGGSVRRRLDQIGHIKALRQRVEIRGAVCMSSCTMYIGLSDVCVAPETMFGFHGPYRFFSSLSASEFESWSRVIASHYPEPIRGWYMRKARYSVAQVSRLRGSELIRLGIPACR